MYTKQWIMLVALLFAAFILVYINILSKMNKDIWFILANFIVVGFIIIGTYFIYQENKRVK